MIKRCVHTIGSLGGGITNFLINCPPYTLYLQAALQIYSSALAKELGGRGISVNALSPGVVNTTLFTDGKTEEQIEGFARRTPHGRIGEPEDIAAVVSAMCSSGGWWVNGETIFANGGLV